MTRPFTSALLLRLQQYHGADKLREHTAPVDVGNQQDGGARMKGDPHVDDVVLPQVDLGGTARAFNYDYVILSAQGGRERRLRYSRCGISSRSSRERT